ncbi:MAG: DNA polymerase III subunit delta [Butyricicoccaceae bacterium]
MAPRKQPDGTQQLKNDLKNNTIGQLYLIGGEETYLKQHYLKELTEQTVDETFRDFNYDEFEGTRVTPEQLTNAVESYPAMAERRMVVVKDFDVFKPPAVWKEPLADILADLPEYICLVFYYDTIALKPDKRTKLYTQISKIGCIADFSQLAPHDLIPWIRRHAKAQGKDITNENCEYMLFLCGTSMTNLMTEISKACAHSATNEVTRINIDAVCSKVLDAVVFDLTDAIADRRFDRAMLLVNDLIAQKNEPIVLLSTVSRHLQRLYLSKLASQERGGEKELMQLLGTKSPYYVRKMMDAARRMDRDWLRSAVLCCGEADAAMKTAGADRQKVLELLLLRMSAGLEKRR